MRRKKIPERGQRRSKEEERRRKKKKKKEEEGRRILFVKSGERNDKQELFHFLFSW